MTNIHPWPMGPLTRDAGERRQFIVKPIDVTPRSNIRPDGKGILRIVNIDKVKIHDCICVPEVKEQGHFHLYCRDADGSYHVFGRKQNVNGYYIDIWDKVQTCDFTRQGLPKETVVAGELVWPGNPDSKVPTAMKDCPEVLKFRAFGIPIFQGAYLFGPTSQTYRKGRQLLKNILPPEMLVEHLNPVEFGDAFHSAKVLENLLQLSRQKSIEGFVLKEFAYDRWWKVKGIREADVYITGFKVSKSETQYGLVTAVKIAVREGESEVDMGSVTGFDLETKREMTNALHNYGESGQNPFMNRVLRVCYQEITGKGKLKHAFYDGWRDDKNFTECEQEQFA